MRILVNYLEYKAGPAVHCLADDARTQIAPFVPVESREVLFKLLRYVGASDEEMEDVRIELGTRTSFSVLITLTPGRKNLLQIREPWASQARLVK